MADPSLTFQGTGERPFLSDFTNYNSMADWWNSLTSSQQIQAGMLGASSKAKRHFNIPLRTDTGLRPSGYTPVTQPVTQPPTGGAGIIQTQPQPQPRPYTPSPTLQPYVPPAMGGGYAGGNTGVGNAGTFNPQPSSPYPTTMPGGLFGGQQQPYQPQTGLFTPNYDNPGGYEAIMHQQFSQMPHIANPAAPEVTLGGSYLNAGDVMRIPSNLMSNVPGLFGAMNNQTQWNGYWGPELTGMVGPHGIAPGYGFYNSNSPVNYTGLFSQSNPFWGNPVASPAFPTPSPQTLSPYMGVGPQSHFGQYFSHMRQNANTTQEVRQQQEQARADARRDAEYEMMGCAPGDTACYSQAIRDQG